MYKNLVEKKKKKKKKGGGGRGGGGGGGGGERYNNVTLKAHGVAYITSESYFYRLLN